LIRKGKWGGGVKRRERPKKGRGEEDKVDQPLRGQDDMTRERSGW
jgi:hypothetical protein